MSAGQAQQALAVQLPPSAASLAELSRRHCLDRHAPATVLVNRDHQCLHSFGPTERYLRLAPGDATLNLFAMVRDDLRGHLQSAILRATEDVQFPEADEDGSSEGPANPCRVEAHRVQHEGRDLLLIYFIEEAGLDEPGCEWPGIPILPHRSGSDAVEGVVPTLSDVTEGLREKEALQAATQEAERASLAASRVLSAASHGLRRPLQTLATLHELLAKRVPDADLEQLVRQLGRTLDGMSVKLGTLLDIDPTEVGTARPESADFSLDALLDQVEVELANFATAQASPGASSGISGQNRREQWAPPRAPGPGVIFLVDDNVGIRSAVRSLLEGSGLTVRDFESAEAFQTARRHDGEGCLLIGAYLPGIGGIELLRLLRETGDPLPAIVMTGHSDVPMAVEAMRAGAADFIERPISGPDLLRRIGRALEQARGTCEQLKRREDAAGRLACLTPRQRSIMDLVLAGLPSKNIAADLGISQRTVETHRAAIMRRTGTKSLPALARLATSAAGPSSEAPLVRAWEHKQEPLADPRWQQGNPRRPAPDRNPGAGLR